MGSERNGDFYRQPVKKHAGKIRKAVLLSEKPIDVRLIFILLMTILGSLGCSQLRRSLQEDGLAERLCLLSRLLMLSCLSA
jgi:hypothetical protein